MWTAFFASATWFEDSLKRVIAGGTVGVGQASTPLRCSHCARNGVVDNLFRAHSSETAGPRIEWDPRRQPWIPVLTRDGATKDVALIELFAQAEGFLTIACSTPGETVAVVEFLLAVCFASQDCPASKEQWREWVVGGHAFTEAVAWLKKQPGSDWDLFDPETPLGQNSMLEEVFQKYATGTAQLVLERAADYLQFFDQHHLADGKSLSAAEAFRTLLTQHVYAPYGRARVGGEELGATLTHLAAGRLLGRIRVVALGATLGETLRLNLYPYRGVEGGLNTSWTGGAVVRRGFLTKAGPRVPGSPADLHSALGRSVLLRGGRAEDGRVVVDRVLIGAGEVLQLDPEQHMQDAVLLPGKNGSRRPLWPSPSRALWQEAHALYAAVKERQPGLYALLESLSYERCGRETPYQLWAVGLIVNKSIPVAWVEGSFPYAPGMEQHLFLASQRGSRIAEFLAATLYRAAVVASRIICPAVDPADGKQQIARYDARWGFWPTAAEPFRNLLDQVVVLGFVGAGDPVLEPLEEYALCLLGQARTLLEQRLELLPPNADGHLARSRALELFEREVSGEKAPIEIRKPVDDD
ncbi:type I-E CRISPR-associated protein Cse1/CasA [Kitasatospora sp. NPDC088134]|uniref:type I-E CRISPR-associated protein Cse1/CasA n=1 Tax=Kitasatospora sp. NPDC088134 TaxID=3364071 RepID=UPI003825329D